MAGPLASMTDHIVLALGPVSGLPVSLLLLFQDAVIPDSSHKVVLLLVSVLDPILPLAVLAPRDLGKGRRGGRQARGCP